MTGISIVEAAGIWAPALTEEVKPVAISSTMMPTLPGACIDIAESSVCSVPRGPGAAAASARVIQQRAEKQNYYSNENSPQPTHWSHCAL